MPSCKFANASRDSIGTLAPLLSSPLFADVSMCCVTAGQGRHEITETSFAQSPPTSISRPFRPCGQSLVADSNSTPRRNTLATHRLDRSSRFPATGVAQITWLHSSETRAPPAPAAVPRLRGECDAWAVCGRGRRAAPECVACRVNSWRIENYTAMNVSPVVRPKGWSHTSCPQLEGASEAGTGHWQRRGSARSWEPGEETTCNTPWLRAAVQAHVASNTGPPERACYFMTRNSLASTFTKKIGRQ